MRLVITRVLPDLRSRKDQQRPLGGLHRGLLFGIQIGEERLQGECPEGKRPCSSLPFGAARMQIQGLRFGSPLNGGAIL